jgi:DNA repair exonuclease SbcCD ATPase subunit
MTFNKDHALTLAAEAEASLDANAGGDWPTPAPDARALASMLRAAVARIAELEARGDDCRFCLGAKGNVRGNENIVEGVVCCDCCSVLATEIVDAAASDRDSLRAKLADADRCARESLVQLDTVERQRNALLAEADSLRAKLAEVTKERDALVRVSVHWEEQTVKWRLEAEKHSTERDTARDRVHELDAECRSLHEMLTAVEHRAGDAEAALGEMTKERDWAVAVQRAALESQERLGTTLAAALKAKDELADIAETLREAVDTADVWSYVYDEQRNYKHAITELRSVGKEKP